MDFLKEKIKADKSKMWEIINYRQRYLAKNFIQPSEDYFLNALQAIYYDEDFYSDKLKVLRTKMQEEFKKEIFKNIKESETGNGK